MKKAKETATAAILPRVVISTGDKGGVGKTMAAIMLATFYDRQVQPWAGIDTDTANKGFTRVFGADRVKALTLVTADGETDHDALNGLLESMLEPSASLTIIDLGAGQLMPLLQQLKTAGLDAEIGRSFDLTLLFTLVKNQQSIGTLGNTLAGLADLQLDLVINLNERDGLVDGYGASQILRQRVARLGGAEIVTTKISDPTLIAAWDASGMPPDTFITDASTRTMHRMRLGKWLSEGERYWAQHAGPQLGLAATTPVEGAAE